MVIIKSMVVLNFDVDYQHVVNGCLNLLLEENFPLQFLPLPIVIISDILDGQFLVHDHAHIHGPEVGLTYQILNLLPSNQV